MSRRSYLAAVAARTLEDVDPPAWGPAAEDDTPLVRRCHHLRTVPLVRLTAEDLETLIGQDIGTRTLLPMALHLLQKNPLLEAWAYPGDLLYAVMRVPQAHWEAFPEQRDAVRALLERIDPDDEDYPRFGRGDQDFEHRAAWFLTPQARGQPTGQRMSKGQRRREYRRAQGESTSFRRPKPPA